MFMNLSMPSVLTILHILLQLALSASVLLRPHREHDSNAAIDSIVQDIDQARDHVHLLFYIWLSDHNGIKIVEALIRAAKRQVLCRAMADGMGSRQLIKSKHWKDMQAAGVQLAVTLPIGPFYQRFARGRIDLRNHRKIVVIDERITLYYNAIAMLSPVL
jgi:cardiolipin synthase